ncbi:MAG: HupE/UreJ family protein [Gammaproteobacteria bacterium]
MTLSHCLALLFCLAAGAAHAHSRSESWSEWTVQDDRLVGSFTLPAREATRLSESGRDARPLADVFAAYLATRVTALSAAGPCRLAASRPLAAEAGYVRAELEFDCEGAARSVDLPVLFDRVQGHTHFARNPQAFAEALLTESGHRFELTGTGGRQGGFGDYLRLGIGHILSGPDHVAFLLALLLAAAHWRNVLIAITGFTVGHSVTLSLAVTGFVHAAPPRVEAFIGYTIALVAAETIALRDGYWRRLAIAAAMIAAVVGLSAWALTGLSARGLCAYLGLAMFAGCYVALAGELDERRRRGAFLGAVAVLFGLVHGLGFAGFLMETGLPADSVWLPLAGFNIGVEVGQVALVAVALALAAVANRFLPRAWPGFGQALVASALCGLGLAWFAGRSLG